MHQLAPRTCFAVWALLTRSALGDEPRRAGEPRVLHEPAEITQVVDAFDEGDNFDLSLSLGFESSRRSASILRETSIVQPGFATGGYTPANLNVAKYESTISRLTAKAELGVFKDIALIFRLPIILSHAQTLSSLGGSGAQQSVALEGLAGEQLFRVPFESPTRSGIEYLAVGVDLAVLNQSRDSTTPTWLLGIEGRFDVSEPMHACNDGGEPLNVPQPQKGCAHPSDVNRDGIAQPASEGSPAEGRFSGGRSPGVSRGVTALELHTYVSRRVKYIEPYAGFRGLVEFPGADSDYGAVDVRGSLENHPPMRGTMLVGINLIPWEIRDRFQRITLDFRFTGTYVSEGRDYSELFDALGSSDAPSLRVPNYAEFTANPDPGAAGVAPSVVDPDSRAVYFTGLTHVQQHGTYLLSASFTWQAGEYVKFNVGSALNLTQGHLITFDQACNPDFDDDLSKSGYCRAGAAESTRSSGIPNPNFRKVVNEPGHRLKVDDSLGLDAWLNATVMF
jgi:hypothetical protein